ncbi:hypothetical protein Hanom_Chr08g00687491 [Helianthus anomalus]
MLNLSNGGIHTSLSQTCTIIALYVDAYAIHAMFNTQPLLS